ncbi:MAG: hypothetical protein ACK5XN_16065 [Bacteroidota bacterium]
MNYRNLFFIVSAVVGSGLLLIPYDLQFLEFNSFISFISIFILFLFIGNMMTKIDLSIFKFIEKNLGKYVGISSGLLYWFIQSISTIILISEFSRYFSRIFIALADYNIETQIAVVVFFFFFNLVSKNNQKLELVISLLKILPLIILPVLCFFSRDFNLMKLQSEISIEKIYFGMPKIVLCFLGFEFAAIIPKNKENSKTFITGMFIVFSIYFLNLLGIFGVMGYKISSYTCYSDLMKYLF